MVGIPRVCREDGGIPGVYTLVYIGGIYRGTPLPPCYTRGTLLPPCYTRVSSFGPKLGIPPLVLSWVSLSVYHAQVLQGVYHAQVPQGGVYASHGPQGGVYASHGPQGGICAPVGILEWYMCTCGYP